MRDDGPSFIELFAGVAGFGLGLERAGWRCVGQVEIDAACQRVLAVRFPGVWRGADVRSVRREELDAVLNGATAASGGDGRRARSLSECGGADLLVGGFPCQDLSVAGKRAGLSGERSGLFYEIVRIAKAIRPTWGCFENVPGLLSSAGGADMGLVLAGLRECWPVVAYRVLDSRYFRVAQRRRRVFFVCGPDEARVAQVLLESAGGGGDLAARGEAGARVAASAVFSTLNAGGNDGGFRTEPGEHLIAFDPTTSLDQAPHATLAPPLKQGTGLETMPWAPAIAFDTTQITSAQNRNNPKPGDPCHPLAAGAHPPALAFAQRTRDGVKNLETQEDVAYSLNNPGEGGRTDENTIMTPAMAVRRLTPTECERLQGFPDGWTCTCLSLDEWARDPEGAAERCTCPDSPRYRQMGNAVTVSVIEWIGRRLMTAMASAASTSPKATPA